MKKLKIFTLAICLLSINVVFAKSSVLVAVELSPAGSFEIKTTTVKGTLKQNGEKIVSKRISVPVGSLKTGIELRDNHLKEKLEASFIHMRNISAQNGKGTGEIEVKGVKRTVDFNYKVEGSDFKFNFELNLPDYKIDGIKYMGVGVQDKVKITGIVPLKA